MTTTEPRLVRVGIVDDAADIRLVLRLALGLDGRFEVVGEAADGAAAVGLVSDTHPDLLILDRNMPNVDGMSALPLIRQASPETAVVLFTAYADANTRQAALAAGASAVREKSTVDDRLLDDLAGMLAAAVAPADPDDVTVSIGPVPLDAARIWIRNTRLIIDALLTSGAVVVDVPRDDLHSFGRFLEQWAGIADNGESEFFWTGVAPVATVRSLVESWARVDAMSDDDLAGLGVGWSPDEGAPFFAALTAGVLAALTEDPSTSDLAGDLRQQWG